MKIRVFISQPMNGLKIDYIKEQRRAIMESFKNFAYEQGWIRNEIDSDDEVIDINALFDDAPKGDEGRIWMLGRSIQTMDVADYIIFADEWQTAHGCCVEHKVAEEYFGYNIEFMKRKFTPNGSIYVGDRPLSMSPIPYIDEIWFGRYKTE